MQYGVRYDSPTIMKGDLFLEACDKLNTVGWFVNSFISSNNVEVESFFFLYSAKTHSYPKEPTRITQTFLCVK